MQNNQTGIFNKKAKINYMKMPLPEFNYVFNFKCT